MHRAALSVPDPHRRAPPALDAGRVWHIPVPLDVEAMRDGAAHLIGRHDFTTFRSAQCQSDSPVKTLDRLDIGEAGEEIHVTAAARSFLHHQVRSMVGCLALVGRGQWTPDDMGQALEARDRSRSASTHRRTDFISSKRPIPRRASREPVGGFPTLAGWR